VLIGEWQCARDRHRWAIGRYVIMPNHVHFFCMPEHQAKTFSVRRCLEDMDQPNDPKGQTAADGSGYNVEISLATRILRSPLTFQRELQRKMELCSRESCARRFCRFR
jgi:hypothetical protein